MVEELLEFLYKGVWGGGSSGCWCITFIEFGKWEGRGLGGRDNKKTASEPMEQTLGSQRQNVGYVWCTSQYTQVKSKNCKGTQLRMCVVSQSSDRWLFIAILVHAQAWHSQFSHPNETHLVATLFPFQSYYLTTPPIIVACVFMTLQLHLGKAFIFFQNIYQPSKFILKGACFLLIFVLV